MLFYQELFWKCAEFLKIDKKQRKYLFTFVALSFIVWVSKNVTCMTLKYIFLKMWHFFQKRIIQQYFKNRLQLETFTKFSLRYSSMSCGKAIYFNRPVTCPKCQSQITFRLNKGSICLSCSIHFF